MPAKFAAKIREAVGIEPPRPGAYADLEALPQRDDGRDRAARPDPRAELVPFLRADVLRPPAPVRAPGAALATGPLGVVEGVAADAHDPQRGRPALARIADLTRRPSRSTIERCRGGGGGWRPCPQGNANFGAVRSHERGATPRCEGSLCE